MRARTRLFCVVLFTLAIAGCGLNVDKTLDIEAGRRNYLTVDAARREQKLKVDVDSPEVPVDVYVIVEKDLEPLQKALDSNKTPANLLASQQKTKSVVLEATIPAGSAAVVLVAPTFGKAAKVRVKLTN